MTKQTKQTIATQGFTLVELSIVIIIIGFLIAGIAAGTSLIKQAELNSVVTDFQSYQTSYNNFLGRYASAPGDFTGAETVWTQAAITAATTSNAGNGDGNGIIDSPKESLLAWKHLSLANMVAAGIAVIPATFPTTSVLGTNVPLGKLSGSGYMMIQGDDTLIGNTAALWNGTTNAVFVGKPSTTTPLINNGAVIGQDAFNIDKKLDDGAINGAVFSGANTGNVRAFDGVVGTNAGDCATTSNYNVATTTTSCVLGIALN